MATLTKRRARRRSIIYIPVGDLAPNPAQPRRSFPEEELAELAESIGLYGVLNPLCVRLRGGRYELVAGERRLRAAKMAGLYEVPCILLDVSMEESSILALVENLQRRDLDFVEEAEGISQLIRVFGLSQEECARRLGRSQSAVANKLRLLRLPPDVLEKLRDAGLSERHGRALLRLGTAFEQRAALETVLEQGLNVAQTERYVASLLTGPKPEPAPGGRKVFVLKDVRVFLNSLSRGMDLMRKGGIGASMEKRESDTELCLTIRIPKNKNGSSQNGVSS